MNYIAAIDPWQPYDNNKNKMNPVVPEPSAYGFMMMGSILLAVFIKKYLKGQR
jgi:hypothetical protein